MQSLWEKKTEVEFFKNSLRIATPETLFYSTPDNRYFAYYPKGYKDQKTVIQSRGSYIGDFTEKWSLNILKEFADKIDAYAVQGVVCEEIELTKKSAADIAICRTKDKIQKPENIIIIFEVKMSIVWNWEFHKESGKIECIGDHTSHQGNPGLLRSDTMLKAIGKSVNIRVCGLGASKIPIIILGNTPITKNYYKKVDQLKRYGIIKGFWSLNPKPSDAIETIKNTEHYGFLKMDTIGELNENLSILLNETREFFAGMKSRKQLGKLIEIANKEDRYEAKAEKFLSLLG